MGGSDQQPGHGDPAEHDPRDTPADALAETKADMDAGGDAADEPDAPNRDDVEDIDLESVYDRRGDKDDASLKRLDPEAGHSRITVKLRAVRQSISTPFGRLVLSFPVALAAVTLAIFAVAFPEWPLITAAGILVPASGVLVVVRYKQWLGHKRYIFRLLETLGEDVSDWTMDQTYRRTRVRRARRR